MRPNYKQMRKNIPSSIKIGRRTKFSVEWHDDIGLGDTGRPLYGITTFYPHTIKLRKDLDDELAVTSFFHEFLHTTDMYKKGQNLSENQVLKLDGRFEYFADFFRILLEDEENENN